MNLRTKTLVILGLTLILSIAVITSFSYTVLLGSYTNFEEKNVRASMEEVLKVITYKISLLEKTCGDWSRWDETYHFAQNGDTSFIDRNLNVQTFDNLDLDLMIFLSPNRSVVYASGYNRSTRVIFPLSDTILNPLLSTEYLYEQK